MKEETWLFWCLRLGFTKTLTFHLFDSCIDYAVTNDCHNKNNRVKGIETWSNSRYEWVIQYKEVNWVWHDCHNKNNRMKGIEIQSDSRWVVIQYREVNWVRVDPHFLADWVCVMWRCRRFNSLNILVLLSKLGLGLPLAVLGDENEACIPRRNKKLSYQQKI